MFVKLCFNVNDNSGADISYVYLRPLIHIMKYNCSFFLFATLGYYTEYINE